jgi:hypothetical protein
MNRRWEFLDQLRDYNRGGQLDQLRQPHFWRQKSARAIKVPDNCIWDICDSDQILVFLNNYFPNNYKDYVRFQNYINQIKYFALSILFRILLKVSCASRTSDVREPHAIHDPRYGHPWTLSFPRTTVLHAVSY